jgi:hypothetical protein
MVTGLMSSPYTPIYTEAEEYAYDSGAMDKRDEILKTLRSLRAAYANQGLWDRAAALDLAMDMIYKPTAEDEDA